MPGSPARLAELARRRARLGAGLLLGLALALPATGSAQSSGGEDAFRLEQNFPNPFTPGVSPTIFTYHLEGTAHVRLTIYNLLAQEVAVLVDRVETAGLHRVAWEGNDGNDDRVPAGVYWYKLQAGERTALRRLLVQSQAPAPG